MVTSNKHYQEKRLRLRKKTITSNGIFWKYWYCLTAGNLKTVFFQQYLLIYLEQNSVKIPKITKQTTAWKHTFSTEGSICLAINLKSTVPFCLLGVLLPGTINNACKNLHSSATVVVNYPLLKSSKLFVKQNAMTTNRRIWQWNSKIQIFKLHYLISIYDSN